MPHSEESFELPAEPPVFGVTDESPAPEDVIKPSSKAPIDTSAAKKIESPPTTEAAGGKKPDKIKRRTAAKPAAIPAASSAPKTVERFEEGELLEQIIADVAKTPSFGREHGKKIIAVSGEDVAKDIRRLVKDLQEEKFRNLPKEEQTNLILNFVTLLTSNARLQADLRAAFREMGLLESNGRKAKVSETPPTAYPTPETARRQRTPEAEKAEALNEYFGKLESGTDFLRKIVDMPHSSALQRSIELSELEQLSGELSQKVLDFFDVADTWAKENKSPKEIAKSGEDFISSAKIPSGCQTAFRTIVHVALLKRLGLVAETLKTSPETKPDAPTPKSPRAPLTAAEIVAHHKAAKAAAEVKAGSLSSEIPKPAFAFIKEEPKEESFVEKFLARRRANQARKNVPEMPPAASTTAPPTETASKIETAPTPSSTTVESVPAVSASVASSTTETTPSAEGTVAGWTPEKIAALTFKGLPELNDDDLRSVVRSSRVTAFGWGLYMQGMPDTFAMRIRGAVDIPSAFDDGMTNMYDPLSEKKKEEKRRDAINTAKEELLEALQHENPPQA